MNERRKMEAEIAIVGSGAGGGTLAKELSEKGRNVLLIEKGKEHQWPIGRIFCLLTIYPRERSREGVSIERGITLGGTTVVFNANAFYPPLWLSEEYGIDLTEEVQEAIEEIGIRHLPDYFYERWPTTKRIVEAAGELGIHFERQLKFVNPEKCDPTCDDCMKGCKRNAKWTAREYVRKARENGARVLLETEAREVIIEGNCAKGIRVRGPEGPMEIYADKVIVAAGGVGTPIVLQRSGIHEAGDGFFADPVNNVLGTIRDARPVDEQTFTYACEQFVDSDGFMIGTLDPRIAYLAMLVTPGSFRQGILKFPYRKRLIGLFTKIAESCEGRVDLDGSISKPLNDEDKGKARKAVELATKILIRAGADPDSIMIGTPIGGHPGGTAPIGKVVNENLETRVKNLYVCDASVFPKSPGRPPVLSIIALAKRLAKQL